MKELALYALETLACSGVLLAAYAILLERRVRFGWCRAYLLLSTLLAAVIPLLRIPVWPGPVIEVTPTVAVPAVDWTAEVVGEAAPAVTPEAICLAVYLLGAALIAGVMLWQAVRIRRLRRGAEITRTDRFTLVRTPQRIASFSFFRSIYVWDQTPVHEMKAIVAHEASHIAHRHSAERIAMECMKAALWWNPFVWIAARRLTEAEEFEADSDVLAGGYDIEHYMQTIFRQLFGYSPEIANGLRDSLTKKRFKMMTTKTSGRHALLRLAATLPALIGLLCAFSFTTRAATFRTDDGEPAIFFKAAYLLNGEEVPADKIRQIDARYETTLMGDEIPAALKDRNLDFVISFTTDGKPRKVKTIDIRGQILFPDGRPAEEVYVYAGHHNTLPSGKAERERLCVRTDADGRFRIKGPAAGDLTYMLGQYAIGSSSYDSSGANSYTPKDLEIPYPDSAKWEKAVDEKGRIVLTRGIDEPEDQPETASVSIRPPGDAAAAPAEKTQPVRIAVTRDGKPLSGAIVVIAGTTRGTVTDQAGNASIDAEPGATLLVTYVGCETQKIETPSTHSGSEPIRVAMKAEANHLDPVSVTSGGRKAPAAEARQGEVLLHIRLINKNPKGFRIGGKAKGAVVRIVGSTRGVVADAEGYARIEAPEGTVLEISYPDYQPASVVAGIQDEYSVLLYPDGYKAEEEGAIFTRDEDGVKQNPIYIVDGVERPVITDLEGNNIDHITILKDKSATDLYGPRAKNGVVVITTRRSAKPAVEEATFDPATGAIRAPGSGDDEPFIIAETMPKFQGGDLLAFRTWVQKQLVYPAEAVKQNIQGRVVVTFVIETDGSVSDIRLLQSPDKLLSDEARRIIASSPAGAWTPGEQRGQKVRVKYVLPVDFRLTKTEPAPAVDEATFDPATGTIKTTDAGKDEPFLTAETMSSFRGGDITAFRQWVQMHIRYPSEALKEKLHGRVVASFIVEKDGSVSNISILQSPGKVLADEARRVIGNVPAGAWAPGKQRGQAVRVKYTMPVDFRIQGVSGQTPQPAEKTEGGIDEVIVVGYGDPAK